MLSWRQISEIPPFTKIPRGTLSVIAKTGKVPRRWREQLGLPPETTVVVISGAVPPGSQAIAAKQCACCRWFISNHPRRKRCFICSPYKGK
jgi:hypothetical protein